MASRYDVSIVWLRRDLRLADNLCLYEAAQNSRQVCCAFVVNPPLLADVRMGAPLVCAFLGAIASLRHDLRAMGSDLAILIGDFDAELTRFARRVKAQAIYYNEDYEPKAIARDLAVTRALKLAGFAVHASVDHVYFGADEVVRTDGNPYRVFTPYKRRWLDHRNLGPRLPVPSEKLLWKSLLPASHIGTTSAAPTPEDYDFVSSKLYPEVSENIARKRLTDFLEGDEGITSYAERRNFPGVDGTSRLSPQLRAGTIGIRTCIERAFVVHAATTGHTKTSVASWISELIWRDFYQMILRQFPSVVDAPFQKAAERIKWVEPGSHFEAWRTGRTGYPIIDAAMRQLNTFGWMHNRLRMLTASFLSKDLLIDWRHGERYFEQYLADADVAQNNGGWQWAASTGTDAVPYFRIFNPTTQSKTFDPEGRFIKQMLPELESIPIEYIHEPWKIPPLEQRTLGIEIGQDYPEPIVDHATASKKAIAVFAKALKSKPD
jgi:deoxyribodipyrimidine photo-lyase